MIKLCLLSPPPPPPTSHCSLSSVESRRTRWWSLLRAFLPLLNNSMPTSPPHTHLNHQIDYYPCGWHLSDDKPQKKNWGMAYSLLLVQGGSSRQECRCVRGWGFRCVCVLKCLLVCLEVDVAGRLVVLTSVVFSEADWDLFACVCVLGTFPRVANEERVILCI